MILVASALGSITLQDDIGRYDPGSVSAAVSRTQLLRTRPVKCEVDGVVEWTGMAAYDSQVVVNGADAVVFRLTSTHAEALKSRVIVNTSDVTVQQLAQLATRLTGIPIMADVDMGLGAVSFSGRVYDLLEEIARITFGYFIETQTGSMVLIPHKDARKVPLAATFDTSYESLYRPHRRSANIRRSRSGFRAASNYWSELPDEQILFQRDYNLHSEETLTIHIDQAGNEELRPLEWNRFTVEPLGVHELTPPVVLFNAHEIDDVDVLIRAARSDRQFIPVRVTGFGQAAALRIGSRQNYTTDREAARERIEELPPWSDDGFTGYADWMLTGLDAFVEPHSYITSVFRRRQTARSRSQDLSQKTFPGSRVKLPVVSNKVVSTIDAVILERQIKGDFSTGDTIELLGIEPSSSTRRLFGEAVPVTQTEFNITVFIADAAAADRLFIRYRAKGSSRWTSLHSSGGYSDLEEYNRYNIDGLTENTEYEVQLSLSASFADPVTLTVTTRLSIPDSLQLKEIRLDGDILPQDDFTLETLYSNTVRRYRIRGTSTILAVPKTDTSTVEYSSGQMHDWDINNPNIEFAVKVSDGTSSVTYSIFIFLFVTPAVDILLPLTTRQETQFIQEIVNGEDIYALRNIIGLRIDGDNLYPFFRIQQQPSLRPWLYNEWEYSTITNDRDDDYRLAAPIPRSLSHNNPKYGRYSPVAMSLYEYDGARFGYYVTNSVADSAKVFRADNQGNSIMELDIGRVINTIEIIDGTLYVRAATGRGFAGRMYRIASTPTRFAIDYEITLPALSNQTVQRQGFYAIDGVLYAAVDRSINTSDTFTMAAYELRTSAGEARRLPDKDIPGGLGGRSLAVNTEFGVLYRVVTNSQLITAYDALTWEYLGGFNAPVDNDEDA
ncbi:MAG: hypothetical protein OXQ29_18075 [Rhodospirillaceae bacterium]|nr:hypothetical protein [Rhodospirillaceae bacterium]